MPCTGDDDSQVREYLRTWSINWLTVKRMAFQVRMVLHTLKSGTPTGCPVPGTMTLRCVNISAPGTSTNCQSGRWRSRCAWFLASGSLVPNTFRSAVCTPETPLLYRTRFGVRFVPQRPISCTEHVSECGLYTRGPSPVPYMFRRVVRTPEAPLLYQTRFECGSYPISPFPVPN